MNINDIKNEVDQSIEIQKELISLKGEATQKYKEFKSICGILNNLINEAVKTKKNDLFFEFNEYFTKNGFGILKENNNIIKATYNDLVITLEDETPEEFNDESIISFRIPLKELYNGIVIKANHLDSSKLYFKNILKHKDDFIEFNNYEKIIFGIGEKNELESLINKIDENINWYNNTIKEFSNIKFIYSLYKSHKEYESFEELFKDL